MKNIKALIIYGVIAVLCIAAFAGYIVSNKAVNSTTVTEASTQAPDKSQVTETAAAAEAAGPAIPAKVMERVKKSALMPSPNPVVGIGRGEDYAKVTRSAIENAGGLKSIIKKGDTVLIKPNICTFSMPGKPLITDYRMVQEIISIVKENGASKIIIAEGPITGTAFDHDSAKANGYDNISGVEFIDLNKLNKEDCYEIKPEKSITGKALFIPKAYMDADVVIGAPKLKTHFQPDAVVSLSLKNIFGVPAGNIYGVGYKNGLHELGLKEAIVDLNKIRKPDFVVIDGIVGGEGYGPLNNEPVNSNIIFAGIDPVAVDTAALTFMGFTVDQIPHVKLAVEEGLGIADLSKIKIVGAELDNIKMKFQR